jgi:hypothetical protein
MASQLLELVHCWMAWGGIQESLAPSPQVIESGFAGAFEPCRPGAEPRVIAAWENRHSFRLPAGLRAWLMLSNGLYLHGPIVHPLSAIGPMVIFSRIHDLLVQPESWFELGNPNIETICIDLAYRWPGGGYPVFTSGDEQSQTVPRIIARSFEEWFLELLRHGGSEYWFDPNFVDLGDPWQAHCRYTPQPELPDRLRPFTSRIMPLLRSRLEEREIANALGLTDDDVELLFRHLQHVGPDLTRS